MDLQYFYSRLPSACRSRICADDGDSDAAGGHCRGPDVPGDAGTPPVSDVPGGCGDDDVLRGRHDDLGDRLHPVWSRVGS